MVSEAHGLGLGSVLNAGKQGLYRVNVGGTFGNVGWGWGALDARLRRQVLLGETGIPEGRWPTVLAHLYAFALPKSQSLKVMTLPSRVSECQPRRVHSGLHSTPDWGRKDTVNDGLMGFPVE